MSTIHYAILRIKHKLASIPVAYYGYTALWGGIGCLIAYQYGAVQFQENLKKADYYVKSLKIVQKHQTVMSYLGEPIETGHIKLFDDVANKVEWENARLAIPLQGSRNAATLYTWASRNTAQSSLEPWTIDRMELSLTEDGDKVLIYKKTSSTTTSITPVRQPNSDLEWLSRKT